MVLGMAHIRTREGVKGRRYDVRFEINGVERTKTFVLFDDAKAYKKKIESEDLAGLVVDPKGGERLFGPYAQAWLEHRLVRGRPLTPATLQGYNALMRRHITPAFGATKLRQITPERVRAWHSGITIRSHNEAGQVIMVKSQDQAAKAYRLLRAILMTAVSDELIPRNPCVIKGAGTEQARERPMIETATVLQLADAIDPRLRCLVLLAGLGGLRAGELLGLQRRDIDPLHGTVTVARQAHEITGQGRILTPPKSEAGSRTRSPASQRPRIAGRPSGHLRGRCSRLPRLHSQDRIAASPPRPLARVERRVRCRRDKRYPYSRPPAPRLDHRRPQSERDAPGTDGLRWSLIPRCRIAVSARHRRAREGNRLVPR